MKSQTPDDSEAKLIELGWIANYPPWFAQRWIKPAHCKTSEEASRLLHLLRAIEDGQTKETERLLKGINPNLMLAGSDSETESLLEWAVQKSRNPDCIRLLIAAGANVKIPNLVLKLVRRGNAVLAEALKAGADPNNSSPNLSPLIAACMDAPEAVPMLLAAGADTNVTTTLHLTDKKFVTRVTPLMAAAYAGQLQSVTLLIAAKVNVNAVDAGGNTAAAWAKLSRNKTAAAKIIALLDEKDASAIAATGTLPPQVDFATRAKTGNFKKALALAKALTKTVGKPLEFENQTIPGAKAFSLRSEKSAESMLEKLRSNVIGLGAFPFLSELPSDNDALHLVIFPTTDYREAISAYETPEGQSINAHDLVEWLEQLEKSQPFVLTHLGPDRLRAKFSSAIKNSTRLAKSIKKICPDVINAPLRDVARYLEKSRELYLWWD